MAAPEAAVEADADDDDSVGDRDDILSVSCMWRMCNISCVQLKHEKRENTIKLRW